jgi:DNA/RNA endonuclease G (NUC1)
MPFSSLRARRALAVLLVSGLAPLAHTAPGENPASAAYIQKVIDGADPAGATARRGKTGWWASGWTQTDGRGFFGMPATPASITESDDTNIIVRYTRYSTEYDAAFHAPVWGAYTLDATAVANEYSGDRVFSPGNKEHSSINPEFARPSQFFQEPLVIAFSKTLGVTPASHATFTSTFDPRYPPLVVGDTITKAVADWANNATASDPRHPLLVVGDKITKSVSDKINNALSIQRGHMVPNNAMKSQGTHDQGVVAQMESFSVANIVPQMARSNAPSWYNLEDACFDWANELGQVWMIVGPVFERNKPGYKPTFIQKIKDETVQVTPSPEQLFYVVIGKRGGKTSAIGFLLTHTPEIKDYTTSAVPVRKIEELTGLNFMPDLKDNNNDDVEKTFDQAWLQTKARPAPKASDNP